MVERCNGGSSDQAAKRAEIVDGVVALIFLDECNISSGSVALYMARRSF